MTTIGQQLEQARATLTDAQRAYDMGAAMVDNLGRALGVAQKRLAALEAKIAEHEKSPTP